MDAEMLSRVQFALTAGFHFIFPPITIGFSLFIVIVEAAWLFTGDRKYKEAVKLFLKLFAVLFAIGVATGIIMAFQFGTNWPVFSNYVGDIFGSPLAIEAIFAFFMESTFLGIALYGWNKIGDRAHFFCTLMVCIGAHLSAIWILVANSFMQTPAGFEIGGSGECPKLVITDFFAMLLNPSSAGRIMHTLSACWLTGAFFALGIASYYVLKNRRDKDFALPCIKLSLCYATVSALAMLHTGHSSTVSIVHTQPEKLAAFEGHYSTSKRAPLYIVGWVDEKSQSVSGLKLDGWLSALSYWDFDAEVKGLRDLPSDEFLSKLHPDADSKKLSELRPQYWAPVNFCFQTFRLMMYLGGIMCALVLWGFALAAFKKLGDVKFKPTRYFLAIAVPSVALPIMASQFGWAAAEVGRQPWTVWHLMLTSSAVTQSVGAGEILFSIVAFTIVFALISVFGILTLFRKIREG